jgi:putative membrane protein
MSNGQKPKIDRQREHQANERTFLAWLRTSIALIGFGFAIARFGLFLRELQSAVTGQDSATYSYMSSRIIGVGLVIVGIILVAVSAWHYNQVFRQIERSDYQPNRLIVWVTAAIVMIIGTLSIPLVLWRQPSAPNPLSPRSSRISDPQPRQHRKSQKWQNSKYF